MGWVGREGREGGRGCEAGFGQMTTHRTPFASCWKPTQAAVGVLDAPDATVPGFPLAAAAWSCAACTEYDSYWPSTKGHVRQVCRALYASPRASAGCRDHAELFNPTKVWPNISDRWFCDKNRGDSVES